MNRGALVERAAPGRWHWIAWFRAERMEGVADDKTNAVLAAWHFLDPEDDLDTEV